MWHCIPSADDTTRNFACLDSPMQFTPEAHQRHGETPTGFQPLATSSAVNGTVGCDGRNGNVHIEDRAMVEFRIHEWRLVLASAVLVGSLAVITFALQRGFELAIVRPGESLSLPFSSSGNISDQVDELNSYSGNVTSVLAALWAFGLQLVLYVLLLSVVPALLIDNSTLLAKVASLVITSGVGFLAVQGFVATNVQLKAKNIKPVLSFADLNGFDRDSMVSFQNFTPFVANASRNPQLSTSTLLRTAIAGSYPREITVCSAFDEGDHDVSVSYGFSSYDWLRYLLPNGMETTASLSSGANTTTSESLSLPMSQGNATGLAVYALDMIDTFFQVQKVVNTTPFEPFLSEYESQESIGDVGQFLADLNGLINATLDDSKPYFQHFSTAESSFEFTHTELSDGILFDAVTLEIPLKRSFFSRTVNATLVSDESAADTSTLTLAATLVTVEEDEDAVYEMSVWDVCSPNGCMLTGLDEVNAKGETMYPDSQVRAVRICMDADGNEDIEGTLNGCENDLSINSFLVFSIASRIEGDAMTVDDEAATETRARFLQEGSTDQDSSAEAGVPSKNTIGSAEADINANDIPGGKPKADVSTPTAAPITLVQTASPSPAPAVTPSGSSSSAPSPTATTIDSSHTVTPAPAAIPAASTPVAVAGATSIVRSEFSNAAISIASSTSNPTSTDASNAAAASTKSPGGSAETYVDPNDIPGGKPKADGSTPTAAPIALAQTTSPSPAAVVTPSGTSTTPAAIPRTDAENSGIIDSVTPAPAANVPASSTTTLGLATQTATGTTASAAVVNAAGIARSESAATIASIASSARAPNATSSTAGGLSPTTANAGTRISSSSASSKNSQLAATDATPSLISGEEASSSQVLLASTVASDASLLAASGSVDAAETLSTEQSGSALSVAAKAVTSSSDTASDSTIEANSSTLVYSVASLATEQLASVLTRKAYLTNARKIYTVTVGRVSWSLQDLAQQFDAQCQATYNLDCLGLTFPLTNSSKHLVVGRQYLPLSNLRSYSGSSYMWTPLAKIKRDSGFGGDFAFKKAFKQSNWPEDLNGTSCKSSREEYIVSSLDNHLYTQHSLQPAYTASLMWLFQYGTANDEIDISKGKTSLAFAANVVNNRVVMSTPTNSSYLTYFACGLILGITMWVTAKSQRNRGVQTPREVSANTVAQVLLNEMHYPPAFVKCMVLPPEKQPLESGRRSHYALLRDEPEDLQDFSISGVKLQHRDNPELCQPLPDARD